jgi:hypothetical protein
MVRDRLSIVARGSRKGLGLFQGLYAANLLRPEAPAGNNHPHSKTWMVCRPKSDFERASADGGKDAHQTTVKLAAGQACKRHHFPALRF